MMLICTSSLILGIIKDVLGGGLGYPLVTFGVAEKKKFPSKMDKLGLEELAWVYSETAASPMQLGLMFGR
jgi:hypothetical protein